MTTATALLAEATALGAEMQRCLVDAIHHATVEDFTSGSVSKILERAEPTYQLALALDRALLNAADLAGVEATTNTAVDAHTAALRHSLIIRDASIAGAAHMIEAIGPVVGRVTIETTTGARAHLLCDRGSFAWESPMPLWHDTAHAALAALFGED